MYHFPDAAVEPYPEFFAAVVRCAQSGLRLAQLEREIKPEYADFIQRYFERIQQIAQRLQDIAAADRRAGVHQQFGRDPDWSQRLSAHAQADVPWMRDLLTARP